MRNIKDCSRYMGKISRLTKANSFMAKDRVIYIVKKSSDGKANKLYITYDYKTKVQLAAHWNKEFLIDFIKIQDLSILDDGKGQQEMKL